MKERGEKEEVGVATAEEKVYVLRTRMLRAHILAGKKARESCDFYGEKQNNKS